MPPDVLAIFQSGILTGLLAAYEIKTYYDASQGNFDITLHVRNGKPLPNYEVEIHGRIEQSKKATPAD